MERLRKSLVLVLVAGLPAAAPPLDTVSPDFCVAAGSMTYRLARNAAPTDYRVRIDDKAPDLRIALADRAETADFTLVDEPDSAPYSCRGAGFVKSVTIVPADTPADMTISLPRDPAPAAFT